MKKEDLLKKYFFNNTKAVALQKNGNIFVHDLEKGELSKVLLSHVYGMEVMLNDETTGVFRIGSYVPDKTGRTKWMVFDIDGGNHHSDPLENPRETAVILYDVIKKQGVEPYLEKSGSGFGWHIWVFFQKPQEAEKLRAFAKLAISKVPKSNRTTTNGTVDGSIEVFPKQNMAKGYGNMVWLPFWRGASNNGNRFFTKDMIEIASPKIKPSALNFDFFAVEKKKFEKDGRWGEWKEEALRRLDLNQIYGEWLTGEMLPSGFLVCRDPDSPSGDRHPSAGVYAGDNDGEHEKGWFHSFRTNKGMDIFDFMVHFGLAQNLKEAFYKIAKLTNTLDIYPKKKHMPSIVTNGTHWINVVTQTWDAIKQFNEQSLFLFRNGAGLVQVIENENKTVMETLKKDEIKQILPIVAWYYRITSEGAQTPVPPPERLGNEVMMMMRKNLPELDRITGLPVYDNNMRLVKKSGYDKVSKIYYSPSGRYTIPDKDFNAKQGIENLKNLTADFPFESSADFENWLSTLLVPFVRSIIKGPVPMLFIEAPTPGSGKTLLAKLLSIILTGDTSNFMFLDPKGQEIHKMITTALMQRSDLFVWDNVSGYLDSPVFAMLLTQTKWVDRLLGQNRMAELNNYSQWVVTANNLTVSQELTRRMCPIRLVPKSARPWEDRGFAIQEPLELFAQRNRGEFIWSIISIIEHWRNAGMPLGKFKLGSYESWSTIIGGILESNGMHSFMTNVDRLQKFNNADNYEWERFCEVWWEEFGEGVVSVQDLYRLTVKSSEPLLFEFRGDGTENSQKVRLSKALKHRRDKVYGIFQIIMLDRKKHRVNSFKLRRM